MASSPPPPGFIDIGLGDERSIWFHKASNAYIVVNCTRDIIYRLNGWSPVTNNMGWGPKMATTANYIFAATTSPLGISFEAVKDRDMGFDRSEAFLDLAKEFPSITINYGDTSPFDGRFKMVIPDPSEAIMFRFRYM